MVRENRTSLASSSSFFYNFWTSALRTKALPSNSQTSGALSSHDGLVRRLGLLDLLLIGIGASIGAGIFVVTGSVAHEAGPGVVISFILAGVSCILNALSYAELASRFPAVVGGAYLYTYTAFNELMAFLVFTQLMFDYHIGAASIARSLASYIVSLLELFPVFKDHIPTWIGHGSKTAISINVLAPVLLALITIVLCRGVGESSLMNSIMTTTKIVIVLVVIFSGAFKVDVSNWSPFAPYGFKAILSGATVVFFAYIGFDAVANSAEEAKRPQRDLPLGIMGSLLVCAGLYIGVCLVITGMVPYESISDEAPLAKAFTSKGLKYVSVLISIGAVVGLTTTLLVGLYVQSRIYLGLGRDGLLPSLFAKVHATRHTPIHSQIWVGIIAGILAGIFNVKSLSHILSVGTLTSYSVVSACVVTLRWEDKSASQASRKNVSKWQEGVLCLIIIACCGFVAGVLYKYGPLLLLLIIPVVIAIAAAAGLHFRQVYTRPPNFSCPWVPFLPAVCIFFNMFLFAQLHKEAWVRFGVLTIISLGVYAFYGQYHANPNEHV